MKTFIMDFDDFRESYLSEGTIPYGQLAALGAGGIVAGTGAALAIGAYNNHRADKKVFSSGTESQKKHRTDWYNRRKGTNYSTQDLEAKFKKK